MSKIHIIPILPLLYHVILKSMNQEQVIALLAQLQQQHPQAFKRNFLFYSLLKTKGMMDELKELIPWVLALMIFYSTSIVLADYFSQFWDNLTTFHYMGMAILAIMLVIRIYTPFVIWQIKHSSSSLYEHLKNTSIKLSIVIVLQVINLIYIESNILQYLLFFFTLSFGFVRLYKESMFLDKTTSEQYYYLQQLRRVTLWAYKNQLKKNVQLKLNQSSEREKQQKYFAELHQTLKNYENKLCSTYKHMDIDSYMDELN